MRSIWHSLVFFLILQPFIGAAEKVNSESSVWMLQFKPVEINTKIVKTEGGHGQLIWYLVYKVTNNSAVEKPFNLRLMAQSDKKVKYVDLSRPLDEAAIERKLGKRLYGRSDLLKIIRKITKGDAKEKAEAQKQLHELQTIKPKETKLCVATFGEIDQRADNIRIFVHNLTDFIGIKEKDGKKVLVEYVLTLDYKLPGDEFNKAEDDFVYVGRKWIKVEKNLPPRKK